MKWMDVIPVVSSLVSQGRRQWNETAFQLLGRIVFSFQVSLCVCNVVMVGAATASVPAYLFRQPGVDLLHAATIKSSRRV